jgi:hypothetical protein
VDDIGLETNSSIALMETTYSETPEAADSFAPKDAPIQRFTGELKRAGFTADQIQRISGAMKAAGVAIVADIDVRGGR